MAKAADFNGEAIEKGDSTCEMRKNVRVWLVTQNNPEKHGVDVTEEGVTELLKEYLESGRITYVAAVNEQSLTVDEDGNPTPHTHILLYWPNKAHGGQVKKLFPRAAIFACTANVPSVKNYLLKNPSGAWYKTHPEKLGEKLPEAEANFWEVGNVPGEHGGSSTTKLDAAARNEMLVAAIREGKSDAEIVVQFPWVWSRISEIRKVRYAIMSSKYRSIYRDVKCLYIEANLPPNMLQNAFVRNADTYVVSDYFHPWDSYCAEKTVVFLNYKGQFEWFTLLNYLSGNFCTLSARFSDAVACYETVVIISPMSVNAMCSISTNYHAATFESYLTRKRVFESVDAPPKDYIRDKATGAWQLDIPLLLEENNPKEEAEKCPNT